MFIEKVSALHEYCCIKLDINCVNYVIVNVTIFSVNQCSGTVKENNKIKDDC